MTTYRVCQPPQFKKWREEKTQQIKKYSDEQPRDERGRWSPTPTGNTGFGPIPVLRQSGPTIITPEELNRAVVEGFPNLQKANLNDVLPVYRNQVATAVRSLGKDFPEAAKHVTSIGLARGLPDNIIAWTRGGNQGYQIEMNDKMWTDPEAGFKNMLSYDQGFSSSPTLGDVIQHEFAHALTGRAYEAGQQMDWNNPTDQKNFMEHRLDFVDDKWKDRSPSQYGRQSKPEYIAEAFTWYRTRGEEGMPAQAAKDVKELIRRGNV